MSSYRSLVVWAALAASAAPGLAQPAGRSVAAILASYAEDYRTDPSASGPRTFGIEISGEGGGWWHVAVGERPERGDAPTAVELHAGPPSEPTFYFTTDRQTLSRLDRGEINALTAMGRARSSDPVPMDLEVMEGFEPSEEFVAYVLPLTFHFWTRGTPEIVPFGSKALTRTVHGGNALVFYYQPGFRSAWFQIEKGQHVNADPEDQTNPFPSMLVMTRGRTEARIGGRAVTLAAQQMLFVPAGVTHEFWNVLDEPAEGILLMFGDGA